MNSLLKEAAASYWPGKEPSVPVLVACGMTSSSLAMTATYPLATVRTKLQASGLPGRPHYASPADAFTKILAADGPRGFYRGFLANLLKVAPAAALSYATFDSARRLLLRNY